MSSVPLRKIVIAIVASVSVRGDVIAEPHSDPVGISELAQTTSVAAARISGYAAYADTVSDNIVIKDADGATIRVLSKGEIETLVPWMELSTGPDGPCSMAWSDSGRRLYISVFDDKLPDDGLPSDAVLLYDRYEDAIVRFARLDIVADESAHPMLASVHHSGMLFVSDSAGLIHAIPAGRNQASSSVAASYSMIDSTPIHGLAVDHLYNNLLVTSEFGLYRASLAGQSLNFDLLAVQPGVRDIAWSSHYGGMGDDGLYLVIEENGEEAIMHATADDARGNVSFVPTNYHSPDSELLDISSASDGSLLLNSATGAVRLTDTADTRMSRLAWIEDEFAQVLTFAKGLIAPDGEPSGWVIDADVAVGGTRFHPATPDGACWVVLLLLMSDYLYADPDSQPLVREILTRYAGLAPTGPVPVRSADGFYLHWIDPATGDSQNGWPVEYATYSTMKIALAAVRAAEFYPGDPLIQNAAREIVCGISGWDSYFRMNNDEVFLIGLGGGGALQTVWNAAFTEAILFVEQAGALGGPVSQNAWTRWIDRSLWPTATYVFGRPVTGETPGGFLPGFITAYPLLLTPAFRKNGNWQMHVENLLVSHAAWTDENGPELMTVFSAGTTKPEWGGYHADSITDHPGDVTTLPALLSLASTGDSDVAACGYHAYRNGARQSFASGASMLYRRSAVDPAYLPNTAGLPDIAMGALGLAELIQPGAIDAVLAINTQPSFCDLPCVADVNGDGLLGPTDFTAWIAAFNTGAMQCDQNGDGVCTPADFTAWIVNYNAGC